MNAWFLCGVRYPKIMENGTKKNITEQYLVSAISFCDAETKIIEEISPYLGGDFMVSTIKRANYTEVFRTDDNEADLWFKCKVNLITLNEKTGAEKKISCYMLVQAATIEDAHQKIHDGMKGTLSDYQIAAVSETNIYDVYEK